MTAPFKLYMTGDLVLDEPNADFFFDKARLLLAEADLLIGHVEVPHTTRGRESVGDIPAPASDPENLKAVGRAGFHMVSLAGNHIHDRGGEGIDDTIANLAGQGLVSAGAGLDLDQARRPAVAARGGVRVGLLSYNCVGPKEGWAGPKRAGCAYLKIITHYELENANPGGPPKVYTFADPDTVEAMQADIAAIRGQVDVLVVAFHKGVVHTPAHIAMYEKAVAREAIEAGADIVIGHHAHILRGVEVWRGKPIFHGLGNFVSVTRALTAEGNENPVRRAWAEKRKVLFGFEPDPAYPLYPFHPEAKNGMVAACHIGADGVISPGFRPIWMTPTGQPEPLVDDARGRAVADYVAEISRKAGLKTDFAWDGQRVAFSAS
ncbi:CapA family protein [Caulobacter segnis]|uniref:Capsule synthesis protein, CapA n=2 Tax=Caulobacter segnis TaxID=88688 RepID=D5VDI0_CAUST|nr:CapA family protein [Caulobacter segnis]ADG10820.1 Capsule synthesis protein, CapA [Caulobacter segnis ATCC 21756]AVQ02523.1 CapA family protein [Caulobacter segnis]